jgi:two-component system cell cycle sensor histidine kinase/response regulator CckA
MNVGEMERANSDGTGSGSVSSRGRVLFMDDKEIVRKAVGEVLRELGYDVACAEDGREALELFRRARAGGVPFDVAVLDLTVAGGMGGREAIEKILEIDSAAKIVVSSGYPNDPVMIDYRKYGASAVIIKPYNSSELDEILTRVIEA